MCVFFNYFYLFFIIVGFIIFIYFYYCGFLLFVFIFIIVGFYFIKKKQLEMSKDKLVVVGVYGEHKFVNIQQMQLLQTTNRGW